MSVIQFEMKHDENQIILGKSSTSVLHLDLMKLIESRMLTCANSGAGKSTLMRIIVERASGKIPFIILDWEGEFVTLREKFDVVLVSNDGEIPIDLRSAKLLARKLIELHASAVIDLSDLIEPSKKRQYVRDFIDSLISLPRSLWNPTIIGIDEAHLLCPEKDKAESAQAVINLLSLGRKRNLCAILASQRISKIHKDALAECKNVFIGNTWLDIDRKRAIDNLGLGKEGNQLLRDLNQGEFFAFGPALSFKGVTRFQADNSDTRPPKVGERQKLIIPKASDVVSHIVEQLADLPRKAEAEIKDLQAAKSRIAELEREAKFKPSGPSDTELDKERQRYEELSKGYMTLFDENVRLKEANRSLVERLTQINHLSVASVEKVADIKPLPPARSREVFDSGLALQNQTVSVKPVIKKSDSNLTGGELRIMTAIAQYPHGASREQLTILTGYKRSSRDTFIQRLRSNGYVTVSGVDLIPTDEGIAALGDFEPLPTGRELQEYWLNKLSGGEKQILQFVIGCYPASADREAISGVTGYKRSSRDTFIQRLSSRRLVDAVGRGEIKASSILFD
jgi:uncharacterized protein